MPTEMMDAIEQNTINISAWPAWMKDVMLSMNATLSDEQAATDYQKKMERKVQDLESKLVQAERKAQGNAPAIERLTKLLQGATDSATQLRNDNAELSSRLDQSAEKLAGAGIPPEHGSTKLTLAAESLAVMILPQSSEWQKRTFLKKRGWSCPTGGAWEKQGMAGTLEVAVKKQAEQDAKPFELLIPQTSV
jgi:hypothetical protein